MTKLISMLTLALVLSTAACSKKGGGANVGVAECDEFLTKLAACGDKIGGNIGDSLQRTVKQFGPIWADNAKDDSMKADLPKSCTSAQNDAKKTYPQCAW